MRRAPGRRDVVVVGGGPTGVEVSGALAELVAALRRRAGCPPTSACTWSTAGTPCSASSRRARRSTPTSTSSKAGVDLRLGVGVTQVHADPSSSTTAPACPRGPSSGRAASPAAAIAQSAGAATGRGGRIDVRPDLGVEGFPGVWAVGDVANIPSGPQGAPTLPQLGSVAQQSGRWAAQNILRSTQGDDLAPFHYKDKGIMAMIGRNAAVAEVGAHRHEVDGPLAFAAWLGVHAMLLSGVHSRTDAFLSWAWDYFDRDHAATVESHDAPRRIAWGDDADDVPHIDLGARRLTRLDAPGTLVLRPGDR